MKNKRGSRLVLTGLLLMAAALFLCAGNVQEAQQASRSAARAAMILENTLSAAVHGAEPTEDIQEPGNTQYPWTGETQPEPEREMPTQTIAGWDYIGTLQIPALGLELGILSRCSDDGLKIAPARYVGSAYADDLVIAAHNYASHFGRIGDLQPGDTVSVTDVEGNLFSYRVALRETLMPDAIAQMTESDWDLTLFTCTVGGAYRVTVRCNRTE